APALLRSVVDRSMPDRTHDHSRLRTLGFYRVQDAVVTNSTRPQTPQSAAHSFANGSRIGLDERQRVDDRSLDRLRDRNEVLLSSPRQDEIRQGRARASPSQG